MRVLILGGTRFIGPPVVRALHAGGHELMLFHRGETESAELPQEVRHLHGPRSELAGFAEEFRTFRPDVLLDMAAMSQRDALAAVGAFAGVASRAVVLSSIDVYRAFEVLGGDPDRDEPCALPLREDSPLRRVPGDVSPTAVHKVLVEQVFRSRPELPGTVLRLPMVYGEADYQRRTRPYLRRMLDGRESILLAERFAGWRAARAYVGDVAAAVVRAVTDDRAADRVYNLGEPTALSEREWVRAIGRAAGWTGEVVSVPEAQVPGHLAPDVNTRQELVLSTGRIRTELGFSEPTPPAEAMARTVSWEREQAPPEDEDTAAEFDYRAEDKALAALASRRG